MTRYLLGALAVAVLFAGVMLMIRLGRSLGRRQGAKSGSDSGLGGVEGAVFGLMGLLVAFTFTGAAERFEVRRHLIVEEANAIGTAYLRVDLLPSAAQPEVRKSFRDYVDKRLAVYRAIPDLTAARALLAESVGLQGQIWEQSLAGCRAQDTNGNAVTSLVVSSLNTMFDITTTRTVALLTHPPAPVFLMLAALVLASAFLAGYEMGVSSYWSKLHAVGFAVLMTISLYIIFDLELPRMGLIQITSMDQLLVEVRQSMK